MSQEDLSVMACQETWLSANDDVKLKNFNIVRKDRPRGRGGGVCLFILSLLSYTILNLNTCLEAVAATIDFPRKRITFCSVYIPPNGQFDEDLFRNLIRQLPRPFIILGDFNAHHNMWGSNTDDNRGEIIADMITDENLFLFNNGLPTYLRDSGGTTSNIDLTIGSQDIAQYLNWEVCNYLHDSDHFPIF